MGGWIRVSEEDDSWGWQLTTMAKAEGSEPQAWMLIDGGGLSPPLGRLLERVDVSDVAGSVQVHADVESGGRESGGADRADDSPASGSGRVLSARHGARLPGVVCSVCEPAQPDDGQNQNLHGEEEELIMLMV